MFKNLSNPSSSLMMDVDKEPRTMLSQDLSTKLQVKYCYWRGKKGKGGKGMEVRGREGKVKEGKGKGKWRGRREGGKGREWKERGSQGRKEVVCYNSESPSPSTWGPTLAGLVVFRRDITGSKVSLTSRQRLNGPNNELWTFFENPEGSLGPWGTPNNKYLRPLIVS